MPLLPVDKPERVCVFAPEKPIWSGIMIPTEKTPATAATVPGVADYTGVDVAKSRLSDEFIREIADAVKGRDRFYADLMNRYGAPRWSVQHWVATARRRGFLAPTPPRESPICGDGDQECPIVDCSRPVRKRGYCSACYYRLKDRGLLVNLPRLAPVRDRFEEKVLRAPGGCWIWQGAKNDLGYGQLVAAGGRRVYAHRFSYEKYVGPIPDGLDLDHLCRTPSCVSPRHLQPVTHQENMRRGTSPSMLTFRLGRCQRGQAMTPENLYVYPDGKKRECRACARLRARRNAERRRLQRKGESA
jgi:hypothetical protein